MGDSFDVFDSWGNFKGKLIPSGWGDAGLAGLAILLWVAMFYAVYLYAKLALNGFNSALKGNWSKTALYWSTFAIVTLVGAKTGLWIILLWVVPFVLTLTIWAMFMRLVFWFIGLVVQDFKNMG